MVDITLGAFSTFSGSDEDDNVSIESSISEDPNTRELDGADGFDTAIFKSDTIANFSVIQYNGEDDTWTFSNGEDTDTFESFERITFADGFELDAGEDSSGVLSAFETYSGQALDLGSLDTYEFTDGTFQYFGGGYVTSNIVSVAGFNLSESGTSFSNSDGQFIVSGQSLTFTADTLAVAALGNVGDEVSFTFEVVLEDSEGNQETISVKFTDIVDPTINGDYFYGTEDGDNVSGLAGNDTLIGNEGRDWLEGNEDNDLIYGNDDEDALFGGLGADTIFGGAENDRLYGGEPSNVQVQEIVLGGGPEAALANVSFRDNDFNDHGNDFNDHGNDFGNDTFFSWSYFNEDTAGNILWGQGGCDLIVGGSMDDILRGGGDGDNLYGLSGNDTLFGGKGDDFLYGGEDDDALFGGSNNEDCYDTLRGGEGDDTLRGGDGDDLLFGGEDDDILRGGFGNDLAYGDGGRDILYTSVGDDTLIGGDGVDTFILKEGTDSTLIRDFDVDTDIMDVSALNVSDLDDIMAIAVQIGSGYSSYVSLDIGGGTTVDIYADGKVGFTLDDLENTVFDFGGLE